MTAVITNVTLAISLRRDLELPRSPICLKFLKLCYKITADIKKRKQDLGQKEPPTAPGSEKSTEVPQEEETAECKAPPVTTTTTSSRSSSSRTSGQPGIRRRNITAQRRSVGSSSSSGSSSFQGNLSPRLQK